jgi:hypothetical protein
MRKRLLIAATTLSLLGVLAQGPASAAPTPSYSVTCVVGGLTTADYGRVQVTEVTFEWFDAAGSSAAFEPITVDITRKGHHGSAFSTTDWNPSAGYPVKVIVTFTNADGSTGQASADCSAA